MPERSGRAQWVAGLALVALMAALNAGLTGPSLAQTVAIPKNSIWRYEATGTDLDTVWQEIDYPDSDWASGPAPLGYGEPYIATVIPFGPDSTNKYRTSYFRRTFELAVPPDSVTSLKLAANYDDGFVAYVNGHEVARRAMPDGPIIYDTYALLHEGGTYELIDVAGPFPSLVAGTNVLAVEVHQNSMASSDLVMDMELAYATVTPVVVTRGPYLQVGTPTSVVVRWRTDQPTDSRVAYGTEVGNLGSSSGGLASTTEHEVALTGLSPGTRYFYAIGSTLETYQGPDSGLSFATAPIPGPARPTRLWIVGDSGTADDNARAVRNAYLGYPGNQATDLWLMLGDNAYPDGSDASYQAAVFDMYPQMLKKLVLWPTRGNHDIEYVGANDYYDIFTLPSAGEAGGLASGTEHYYSFDFANIHLICLDSEGSDRSPGGAMMTWLANDLAATSRDWVLAFWHHPPYSKGSHNSDSTLDSEGRMQDMRMNALPVLEAGGVDLVLTGHSHSYERSFLIDGHYDVSSTLTSAMKVDSGDGRVGGNGPYRKPTPGIGPHEGTVYTVAGCSGLISGGLLNHPVMISSLNVLGSVVVDIDGLRLEARFLDRDGVVRDSFVIDKGLTVGVPGKPATPPLMITASRPNPFASQVRMSYALPVPGRVRLSILDVNGRRVRTLVRRAHTEGSHEAVWDGRDDEGLKLGAGVYFAVLELGEGERTWATKLVLAP